MKSKNDVGTTITVCRYRIRDAKEAKVWIKIFDKWYTPEEFESDCNRRVNKYDMVMGFTHEDIKLIDPIAAIKSGRKHISELENKLLTFTKKVIKYYQEGPDYKMDDEDE
ncbi:hypothetical protein D3C72_700830 [compost metagenome]